VRYAPGLVFSIKNLAVCAWPCLFYYDIWSYPFGFKLFGALSLGAPQKYQISQVKLLQSDFLELLMLVYSARVRASRYAPGLVFSITTYGPIHLGSNFLVLSVLGLRRSTRFPKSNSCNLTFRSLHALVCC
jgi:hypothetical protein